MATDLRTIQDLEAQLHSYFFSTQRDFQDEMLWLLDELQELHTYLDRHDIPAVTSDASEFPLNLIDRVRILTFTLTNQIAGLEDRLVAAPDIAAFADEIDAKYAALPNC